MEKNNAAEKAILKAIVVQPARVDTADIETWKSAVNNAKRGNRTALYNLYENLLSDPVLSEAVEQRVEAITNAEITFMVDGKNVEEIDDLIDTPEFEEMIREIALQKAWGKSVIDTKFDPEFEVFSFPRKNIRIRNMEKPRSEWKKYIAAKEADTEGYDYTKDEFIIECGKDDDLGYMWKAAQYVIYKRGGFGDWAQFAEIFGMPFVTGRYNSYDTNTRDQLYEALGKIGGKPYAAIPKEAEIEIHENKSSGSNDLYGSLRRACNEEILIAVKGNTMTTLDGSSRAQAEVHEDMQGGKTKSDRRYVQRMLNKYFVPLLVKRGYPVAGGFFLFPEQGKKMTTAEQVDMGLKLRSAGIAVADNYFYEITGIPASEKDAPQPPPAGGGAEKEKSPSPSGEKASPNSSEGGGKEAPPKKEGKKAELSDKTPPSGGRGAFFDFFADAPTTRSGAIKQKSPISLSLGREYPKGERGRNLSAKLKRNTTLNLADAEINIDINELINQALRELYDSQEKRGELVNRKLFEVTNSVLQTGADKQLAVIDDKEFINQFRSNIAVFSAFKNHLQTKEIVGLLLNGDGKLRSFYEFKKLALQVSQKYNINWLRTEYNTAVRTARMAANMKQWEKTLHLYPNLEYLKTTASNPDEEHLSYVGTVLPLYHEAWSWLLPPKRWGCQCRVRPTDKPVTPVPERKNDIDPAFVHNPYTAQMVDIEETLYFRHTDGELRERVEREAERIRREILKEQRAETLASAKKTLIGKTVFNKEFGFDINFTVKGIKEAVNNPISNQTAKMAAIVQMRKLLKTAKYTGSAENGKPEQKPHIIRYHYFDTEMNGVKFSIVVEENKQGEYNFYTIVDKTRKATE